MNSSLHDETGKKVKNVEENRELPIDVLDIISQTLDFDDFFWLAGVWKNWRTFHKIHRRNFLASQEPLILQVSYDVIRSLSIISIPDQKINYRLNIDECFWNYAYVTSSNGYFISVGRNNSILLLNPFTKIKKVINTCPSEVKPYMNLNRA
ncbi:hypothetical protein MTR_1g109090 [Medicago truncatula]|uniref:F-box domain-containing protein n=1 Tax=Medicago truncatula TaxID=3880 RepID=A0A072VQS1_MEDTR|nr:hypothetical protein MTR_1g109090 [Medicago truncatula]